jgi:hypothetical protein
LTDGIGYVDLVGDFVDSGILRRGRLVLWLYTGQLELDLACTRFDRHAKNLRSAEHRASLAGSQERKLRISRALIGYESPALWIPSMGCKKREKRSRIQFTAHELHLLNSAWDRRHPGVQQPNCE